MGHTKEPWTVFFDAEREKTTIICADDNRELISVRSQAMVRHHAGEMCGLSMANALRAAACVNACEGMNPEAVPELLAACQFVQEHCTLYGAADEARDKLTKAIAKAKEA